jgi:hypothetical protein
MAESTRHRRIDVASSRQVERCTFMSVGALPSSAWSSGRSERACEPFTQAASISNSSSFSCLLSIQTDEPENRIFDKDFETPLHVMSDDSKLQLMEEGKLEAEGFGVNDRTPLVGVAHPAWTSSPTWSYRGRFEEHDENAKTPLSHGAVWPVGISKVQPLAPLDLGPGWCELDKLKGSESLVGFAVEADRKDSEKATSKQKRD